LTFVLKISRHSVGDYAGAVTVWFLLLLTFGVNLLRGKMFVLHYAASRFSSYHPLKMAQRIRAKLYFVAIGFDIIHNEISIRHSREIPACAMF
jgi:hypothetical protein